MNAHHKLRVMQGLSGFVALAALAAALAGVLTSGGPDPYSFITLRGERVLIYGTGLYRDMSADVAIQGIAQDWVTIFLAVPALLASAVLLPRARRGGRLIHAGVTAYFLVGYTMYLGMAMYNSMFLVYVLVAGGSLLLLLMELSELSRAEAAQPTRTVRVKLPGVFLIVNGANIALLWLSVVVPPLLSGELYPAELAHYTTMIVQGFDLAYFLPLSIVSGALLLRRHPIGYYAGPVYLIFLVLQMTNLTAKLTAMGLAGDEIMPGIVIIPATLLVALFCAVRYLSDLRRDGAEGAQATRDELDHSFA
ncbi:MAG: hypothetical protein ACOC8L_03595 [Spirochaetota bacterium]